MDPVFFHAPAPPPGPVPPRVEDTKPDVPAIREAVRKDTIQQCYSVLLGEVGRLRKLQQREFSGSRDAQIATLFSMATKLRKLK